MDAFTNELLGESRSLNEKDLVFEFLLNALRLKHGFSQQQFEFHTGLSFAFLASRFQSLQDDGLLVIKHGCVRCSALGYRFLDEVLQRLLPGYS